MYVIGIDGGGSTTKLVLIDHNLTVYARATTGSGNPNYVGVVAASKALREGVESLLGAARLRLDSIGAIGAGLAGLDRPVDHALFSDIFNTEFPEIPHTLENDAVPVLYAATGRANGIVAICGTGMISLGISASGERARAGGWGHVVDVGSGYWIARQTLHELAKAVDQGEHPPLLEQVLDQLGLGSAHDLISWLYAEDRRIDQIAALAAVSIQAGENGDVLALRILTSAVDSLAEITSIVVHRLRFGAERFPVVMSGSILTRSKMMQQLFTNALQTLHPHAVTIIAQHDAAVGAGIMALRARGITAALVESPELRQAAIPMRRATERRHPLTDNLHRRSTLDLITLMNIEDRRIADLIRPLLPRLSELVDEAAKRFRSSGRILAIGAGTSGRLAVLDASECPPTFGIAPEQVEGIIAGGDAALRNSVEGAEDGEADGRAAMVARGVSALDTVIGIAASGSTPYVIGALREAIARGALTACIVNAVESPIAQMVQYPLVVPTGSEIIMGSTRLKAGTAQKLVLNMISTGVMVRVGRVFRNLMTEMRASNIKLRDRAVLIVAEAADLDLSTASELLARSNGEIKTAVAAALLNVPPDEARLQLLEAGGDLGAIIG